MLKCFYCRTSRKEFEVATLSLLHCNLGIWEPESLKSVPHPQHTFPLSSSPAHCSHMRLQVDKNLKRATVRHSAQKLFRSIQKIPEFERLHRADIQEQVCTSHSYLLQKHLRCIRCDAISQNGCFRLQQRYSNFCALSLIHFSCSDGLCVYKHVSTAHANITV